MAFGVVARFSQFWGITRGGPPAKVSQWSGYERLDFVETRHLALGGKIRVIRKPGGKHQPHSLPNPAPIVEKGGDYLIGTKENTLT